MESYNALGAWAQENETFRGDELDEKKTERLERLQAICAEITERDGEIERPFLPFDSSCRNGGVQLKISTPFFCRDNRVRCLLADLLTEADSVWISAAENCVTLSADVLDMWSKFHYEARKRSSGNTTSVRNADGTFQSGQNVQVGSPREIKDGTAGQIGREVGVDGRTVRDAERGAEKNRLRCAP